MSQEYAQERSGPRGLYGVTDKKTFSVAMIGIGQSELQVLRSIFKLSMSRERSYVEAGAQDMPQILMVASDNEAALAELRSAYCGPRGEPRLPTILVGKNKPTYPGYYHIGLPMRATRVLTALDQVTVREFNYTPELTIGKERASTALSDTAIREMLPGSAAEGARRHAALVVDDSETVRKQLEIQLNILGIDVDLADDGERGMELIKHKQYSVVFLDVVMPGVDGYKVCKAIKKNPAAKQTPVVMLTSKSSPFDKVRGTLAGCDSYLTKPVEPDAFQKVVRMYLSPATDAGASIN